jgi:DNA-binding LacI/PurR family transcriptional regulator
VSARSREIITGVEDVARAAGFSVVLTESGSRHAPAADWIDGVLQRRPVGVVLVSSAIPDQDREVLTARSIPFVLIDPAGDPTPDVPSVGSANGSGGLMAARHLIELGHRRMLDLWRSTASAGSSPWSGPRSPSRRRGRPAVRAAGRARRLVRTIGISCQHDVVIIRELP